MKSEFELALAQIAADKGLATDEVLEAVRAAVDSAYRDLPGALEDIDVHVDGQGSFSVHANRTVVEHEVTDPDAEISLADAIEVDENLKFGDIVQVDITPQGFSRIAAQKARQAMLFTLREAERSLVHDRYVDHVGELMVGKVARIDHRGVVLEFGRAEAMMPPMEQIPTEHLRLNQRIRVYLMEVNEEGRGPQLRVSRRHSDFVRRLFEREIPEIANNAVEIVNIARDAGIRTKVAVRALQDGLDPVGSCVGMRGSRIQNIVRDLVPEKVEIVEYSDAPVKYVANALSPAQVISVNISIEENLADVLVAPDMVSLAIGREGQNSRLAARLTGWRINIRDASAPDDLQLEAAPDVLAGVETDEDGDGGDVDLPGLTVPELRALAAEKEISLTGLRRKADIIGAIEAAAVAEPKPKPKPKPEPEPEPEPAAVQAEDGE
jgi:N utilization substance protein A